jgi:DNA-directed RNA polymerase subunit RPC12/RpoP
MERIRIEQAQFADGSIQKTFIVKCSVCGEGVFINTITKDPEEYDYYCLNCGQFVEQDVMDEIIRMIE